VLRDLVENYKKVHRHPVNQVTHVIGIPLIVISLPLFFFRWKIALALFGIGWILQFVGHAFEGKAPAFFQNPTYLFIGPVWMARKVMEKLFRK
jgi:uncharacterized membrane protein YGL010W